MSTAARPSTHDSYSKGGTLGIKGGIYQLKWLMLFLYRGLRKSCNFRLATEMESAEKFDDIFFEYTENEKKVYRFLQAKHKENEKKGITFDDLLNEGDSDFALLKYFISYRKIKSKEEFKEGILRDIIICTNLEFNFGETKSGDIFREITCDDDILGICKDCDTNEKSKLHKFKDDFPRKQQVYDLLRKASPLHRFAKKLAHCFLYSKLIEDYQKNSIFKECSGVLAKHILDTESKRFRTNFLTSISEELPEDIAVFQIIFRREVEEEISRTMHLTPSERKKKNMKIINRLNLKSDVLKQIHALQEEGKSEVILNSKKFGEKFKNESFPSDLVSDEEIEDFLNILVFAVNQPNEEELGLMIQKEIGKEFSILKSKDVYNSVFVKMLDWMKEKEGRFLSHEDGKKLFENARRGLSVWFDVKEPVEFFTGREQELKTLHSLLQSRSKLIIVPCVLGLGGVGKSELVRKYVQEYSKFYEHNIMWINSETRQTMVNSFLRLANDKLHIVTEDSNGKRKHLMSIVEDVYRCFAQSKCLFIFDNATAFTSTPDNEGIDEFLPNLPSDAHQPYIIITSRNQNWRPKRFRKLILNVFTTEEAFEFIKTTLNPSKFQRDEILRLADTLQYLPLALQQAVSYIKQCDEELKCVNELSEFTINQYLESLHENSKDVLNFSFIDDNIKTTYMTWNTTVEKIKLSQHGEKAIEILSIIAYLVSENISSDWFLPCVANDEMKLGKILLMLKNYSMIEISGGLISIHRLVQKVQRISLEENNNHKVIAEKCVLLLKKVYPYGDDLLDDCSKKRKVIPHLENILSISDDFDINNKGDNLLDANNLEILLTYLADGYGDLGSPLEERDKYERLLNCISPTGDPGDLRTIGALIGLGTAWGDLGNFEKQKELCQNALSKLEGTLNSTNNVEFIRAYILNYRALIKLATAYSNLGHPSLAIKYFNTSLQMVETVRGREHYEYADILRHLAGAYGRLGQHQSERDLLEQAFPILEKHYGSEHYFIGGILGMLGAAYSDLNDDQKAMEYLQKSLVILESYYGSNHFQVADTLRDLGVSLWKLGRYNEAKEAYERNISIFEKHYGKDNLQLITPLKNLSVVCGCLGNRNEEIRLLKRVIRLQRKNNLDPNATLAELRLRSMGLKYEYGVGNENFSPL